MDMVDSYYTVMKRYVGVLRSEGNELRKMIRYVNREVFFL